MRARPLALVVLPVLVLVRAWIAHILFLCHTIANAIPESRPTLVLDIIACPWSHREADIQVNTQFPQHS